MWLLKLALFVAIGLNVWWTCDTQYTYGNGGGNSLLGHSSGLPNTVRIGGLFDSEDPAGETAFKMAVERVNQDQSILPGSRLQADIERLNPADSFRAADKVCKMLSGGSVGILGPQSPESASHVQDICDAFDLPHIEVRWDHRIRREKYLINLHPHPSTLSRAYNDLVEAWNWEEYMILYETDEGLHALQDLILASNPPMRRAHLRQLPPSSDYRSLLRDLLYSSSIWNIVVDISTNKIIHFLKQAQQVGIMTYQYSFILTSLDLHTLDLEDFKYSEANITAFRLIDVDRPEVQKLTQEWKSQMGAGGGFGSTGYSSPSYGAGGGGNYGAEFSPYGGGTDDYGYGNAGGGTYGSNARGGNAVQTTQPDPVSPISTEVGLIYDAVYLFGKALHVLDRTQRIDIRPLKCESTDTWQHGYSIINYMKMVQSQGITGLIQFNTTGFRTDVQLDVVQLGGEGLKKIGTLGSKLATKFNWTNFEEEEERVEDESIDLKNRTLIVTTILVSQNSPFCMFKKSVKSLKGNEQYEGYNIDLLERLSEKLGFKYIVRIVGDRSYGSIARDTGKWNGMIKEIMDGVADIAVADLTINKDRQKAVDFTMPFMNLGVSILYVQPRPKPPQLFSFMSPFSLDVWIYMSFAFFGVSFILFIIGRLTPYEWNNPHPCIEDPDELENQFNLANSFWFTIGSIMQQGSDIAPVICPNEWRKKEVCAVSKKLKWEFRNNITCLESLWFSMAGLFRQTVAFTIKATSTRIVASIWWFFTLIMVSSYTANLASFLIVQELDHGIKSLEDLASQTKVHYGCVGTGSTISFFRDSDSQLKRKIYEAMTQMVPSPFMNSNKEGVDRVKEAEGMYAFFMESTVLEYNVERVCGLAQVGGQLDNKGYGIALKKGSRYRSQFTSVILSLQEAGVLDTLKRKWWKEQRKGETCPDTSGGGSGALRLAHVGGVFVVLVVGCLFAVLIAFIEVYLNSREVASQEDNTTTTKVLMDEIKFALKCKGDTKPVKKKSSVSNSGSGESGGNNEGSTQYLDLAMNSYGFPKPGSMDGGLTKRNGGLVQEGYT